MFFTQDEATFSLVPYTTRGWYPRGKPAFAKLTYSRGDRFYAVGVSNGSKEYFRFYDGRKIQGNKRNINSKMTIDFLKYLLRKFPKLLIIWDDARHHSSKVVQAFAAANDVQLLVFPTACPELNPEEQVWKFLKSDSANTFYEGYVEYLAAVKRKARLKNLTKMFKYMCL